MNDFASGVRIFHSRGALENGSNGASSGRASTTKNTKVHEGNLELHFLHGERKGLRGLLLRFLIVQVESK
jgi:hypothetical protein